MPTFELIGYNTDCRYREDVRWREYTRNAKKAARFGKIPKIQFSDSGHGIVFMAREHNGGKRGPQRREVSEWVGKHMALIEAREKAPVLAKEEARLSEELCQLMGRHRDLRKRNDAMTAVVRDACLEIGPMSHIRIRMEDTLKLAEGEA